MNFFIEQPIKLFWTIRRLKARFDYFITLNRSISSRRQHGQWLQFFQIPSHLPHSINGNLITCFYFIKASLVGGFGVSNVITSAPVRIVAIPFSCLCALKKKDYPLAPREQARKLLTAVTWRASRHRR